MDNPFIKENTFGRSIVYLGVDAADAAAEKLRPFADDPRIAAVLEALTREVVYLECFY